MIKAGLAMPVIKEITGLSEQKLKRLAAIPDHRCNPLK